MEYTDGNYHGWAAKDESGILSPYRFNRRVLGSDDVSIKITHCGVCYGDVIWTKKKFGDCKDPVVPGHEIAGVVKEVGSNVSKFKVGDRVGVGTYTNSCRDCELCNEFLENHCSKRVFTFNCVEFDGTITEGGYSNGTIVHESRRVLLAYPCFKATTCSTLKIRTLRPEHTCERSDDVGHRQATAKWIASAEP